MRNVDIRAARLAVTSALALAAMLLTTLPARAGTLQIRPAGEVRAISLAVSGDVVMNLAELTINCPTTLTLDLDSTADKTNGVQFGRVREAESDRCEDLEGHEVPVRYLNLPWTIAYDTITGGLPSEIAEVLMKFANVSVLVRPPICGSTMGCLYTGEAEGFLGLIHFVPEEPYANELLTFSAISLGLSRDLSSEELCPPDLSMTGAFELEPTQLIVDER